MTDHRSLTGETSVGRLLPWIHHTPMGPTLVIRMRTSLNLGTYQTHIAVTLAH